VTLKDLFVEIFNRRDYDISTVDTSSLSVRGMIAYVAETYSKDVKYFNVMDIDNELLDELLTGDDISLRVMAALSKINKALPHLRLKTYV